MYFIQHNDIRSISGVWHYGIGSNNGDYTVTYRNRNRRVYIGNFNFKNNKRHGKGKMTYHNGVVYEGNWENGKRHGQGTLEYSNGDFYQGNWENGKRHGPGDTGIQ